jgi:hypothetical protein
VARSISGVICAKAAVNFCWRSASFCGLCLYTSDLTYPQMKKSGEFASHVMGPSRPHQRFLYVSSKNNVAEPYIDILPAHIQTNCSEICTLTSCIQRFTFLTSQTDHPVITEAEIGGIWWPRPSTAKSSSEAFQKKICNLQWTTFLVWRYISYALQRDVNSWCMNSTAITVSAHPVVGWISLLVSV